MFWDYSTVASHENYRIINGNNLCIDSILIRDNSEGQNVRIVIDKESEIL